MPFAMPVLLVAVDSDGHVGAAAASGSARLTRDGDALTALATGPGPSDPDAATHWLLAGDGSDSPLRQGFALLSVTLGGRLAAATGNRAEIALYWARLGGGIVVATRPADLIRLLPAPPAIDPSVIADLVLLHDDPARTPFVGVHRLPLGHRLDWQPGSEPRVTRWFDPRPAPLDPAPGEDAVLMRRAIADAVRDSLPSGGGTIAATLSAGLDSSMVLATAASAVSADRLIAATHVPLEGTADPGDGWEADDGPLAEALSASLGLRSWTPIRNDARTAPLEAALVGFPRTWLPQLNPANAVWIDRIVAWAREADARVVLTGASGNGPYSTDGSWVPGALAAARRWGALAATARERRRSGRPWVSALRPALRALAPRPVVATAHALRSRRGGAPPPLVREAFQRPETIDRYRALFAGGPATRAAWRDELLLRDGLTVTAMQADAASLWFSDPLGDARVIELALALPPESFVAGGIPRSLARRASEGLVPDDIRLRRALGAQGADIAQWLAGHEQLYRDALDWIATSSAAAVIDLDAIRASIAHGFPADAGEAMLWEAVHGRALGFGLFVAWYESTVTGQAASAPASLASVLATAETEST